MNATAMHTTATTARRLAVALTLLLLLGACSGASDDSASDDSAVGTTAVDVDRAEVAEDTAEAESADSAAFAPAGTAADEGLEVAQEGEAEAPAPADDADQATPDESPAVPPVDTTGTAATGERIIKEGTVTLVVEPGQFDVAFSQVVVRAQELGGHVSGTASTTDPAPGQAGEDGEVLTTGQVTIRIPVRNFEALLTAVGDAGEITDRNVSSQDVTAEYTDLESRRRNLQAQERFYLGLLEDAQTVPDAIAVQQQLEDLQGQIEEITGRLNLLGDRSAFSTLTVRISEEGAAELEPLVDDEEPGGLTPYLQEAADVLIATVGAIIVVSTFLLPFLAIGLVAYLVWRSVRRPRRAPAAPQAPPATPAEEPLVGVGSPDDGRG